MRTKDKNRITSKSFSPNGKYGIWLFEWDIAKESTTVAWVLIEQDYNNNKFETEVQTTFTCQTTWDFKAGISAKVKELAFNLSGGYNNNYGSAIKTKTKISIKESDGVIAKGDMKYHHPLITKKRPVVENHYPVEPVFNGNTTFMIIQPDLRN
ncbi:hypothetical protein K5X82_09170 [Halosquirtibacter xylanolyticus]|uniref:hypothetical protein n=1 Tax=Halosquirtibacter xylanolyticus TaxID=3374599 RepID=UPI00374A386C|nr:hypothetical protein K5X82_09170 [Prolixibacteraceae bacterium]